MSHKSFFKLFLLSSIIFFQLLIFSCQTLKNVSTKNECIHDESSFNCVKYVRNYDGDTITFEIPDVHPLIGKNISVRVYGVDTPEIRTKDKCEKEVGIKAKEFVADLFKNAKRVDLVNIQRDKYFRILADVHLDGVSLGKLLLKNKLAFSYDGGTKKKVDWCSHRLPAAKEANELLQEGSL